MSNKSPLQIATGILVKHGVHAEWTYPGFISVLATPTTQLGIADNGLLGEGLGVEVHDVVYGEQVADPRERLVLEVTASESPEHIAGVIMRTLEAYR